LSFAAPDNGRYDIMVRPLAGVGASQGKCLTWSDWGQMMGAGGGKGGQQGCTTTAVVGDATLMVA
jgi:hypothetical protein